MNKPILLQAREVEKEKYLGGVIGCKKQSPANPGLF